MKNTVLRKLTALLLAVCIVAALLPPIEAHAAAADIEVEVTVPHTQTDSNRANYFVFADGQWEAGNAAHTWSKTPSAANPSATYYEVHFTGHKIDVYAGKNTPMGIVEYFIDDNSQGEYDLYNGSNINETKIATFDNLSEGSHIFKAVATGKKNSSAGNTLIDCAKVVVYSYQSASEPLYGAIVDDDLQYVQANISDAFAVDAKSQSLNAWRNDTAVSQIFLAAGGSDLHNLTATTEGFSDGNGNTIPASQVTLSFIQTVQAYTGMPGYGSTTRPVPEGNRSEAAEVLMGDTVGTLENGKVKGLWVSINVPKDAEPGQYQGQITVTADGLSDAQKLTFNYTLSVASSALPDAAEFKDGFDIELWQNPYASAEYYNVIPFSTKHFEILTPIMEKYKSIGGHAITATIVDEAWSGQTYSKNDIHFPSMVKWTKTSAGAWSFDYTDLDKWIEFNKETIGIGDKIVCYSIAPWTNAIPYRDETSGNTVSISKNDSTQWNAAWTAFLTSLMAHMEEKGWKDETYIGIDERGFSNEAFDLIDSVTGTDGEPFKTAGAMDGFVSKKALAMRVDDLNVGSTAVKDHPTDFAALVADREKQGLRTTVYSCTGHAPGNFSLSAPGESYWTMMYSYSVGGAGFLRWSYDSWVEDPLRDTTHCSFEAGDCFSIFPDEKTADHPVAHSSLRLEKMAQGVRDVNKLIIIKKNCPAMESAVDTLMAAVKATYDNTAAAPNTSGAPSYYLTAAGKASLAADMKTLRAGIATLTEEYEERLATGDTKKLPVAMSIPQVTLPEEYLSDVEGPYKDLSHPRVYLAHPDMIQTKEGKLIAAMAIGHGKGALIMKTSDDFGETWVEKTTGVCTQWANSYETPTLYTLDFQDGSQKLIMVTGRPNWYSNPNGGWDTSISSDGGETWTYCGTSHPTLPNGDQNWSTVAMASLVHLKDGSGNYIDKWMGIYHNAGFYNYKTYLTFDQDGNPVWSAPELYLSKYRAIETSHHICEVGMFRSPDGNRIVALARADAKPNRSLIFWSDDEGETWSKPLEMQTALMGERHKAIYDPASGRMVVFFRELIPDKNGDGVVGDWMAGEWVAWVGTYEDLIQRNEGQYRIVLDEDFCRNTYSGDTGYSGITTLSDGTIIAISYGHWDEEFTNAYYNVGNYSATKDLSWIRQAKFKLAEMDVLYQAALDAKLDEIPSDVLAKNADANSKQLPAANSTDGGPAWAFDTQERWWHSRYSGTADEGDATNAQPSETNPIWIQTGFDEARYIKELSYQPRTRGNNTCNINAYEVQLACLDDPTATPTDDDFVTVKRGNLPDNSNPQTITLDKAYKATHIRLVATGPVYGGNKYVTAKRIRIYAARAGELLPPDEITITGEGVVGSSATLITNVEAERTLQLSITTTPANRNQSVEWESTHPEFATVDENGLVTAVANGTTAIIAKSTAGGVEEVTGSYTIRVVTRIESITVKKGGTAIDTNEPIKVYVNEGDDAHPNSVTLTTETTPADIPHPGRNWVQPEGTEDMISIDPSGTNNATAAIAAIGDETDVGEVTVRVESAHHPEVYTDFKIHVIRWLDNDIHIDGSARVGSTLTASDADLVMTDEGKAGLSYQWYRGEISEGTRITGATGKKYTVTEADIGKVLFVTATADPETFYEGIRTARTETSVVKGAGPAAPTGLGTVPCTEGGSDGKITGLNSGTVYQWKPAAAGDNGWTTVTGVTSIDNLPAGNYQVRIAATDTYEAGRAATVTIGLAGVAAYTITAEAVEGGVIDISASQAAKGTEITVTLIPDVGYDPVEDSLDVTYTDNEGVEQTVTVTDGVFTMPEGNVTVSARFTKKTFTITHSGMENVTCSLPGEHMHTVEYGDTPNITLTAKEGYTMPGSMTVTYVENGEAKTFRGYEYSRSATNPDTATLKFTSGITADLTVTAVIPAKIFAVGYTLKNGLTAPTENAPRRVGYKAAYTGKLVAEDPTEYTLPLGVQVTMGGDVFTEFDYNSETGIITIEAGKITGDLVITASGVDASVPVVPVTGVEVQKTLTVQVGRRQTLTAAVKPADATDPSVVWQSADSTIAAVDENGEVTGVSVGETEITVTTVDGHRIATCKVTVVNNGSGPSMPMFPGAPAVTPTVTTETKVNGDGSTTTTVTDNATGTVTETTVATDGGKVEKITTPEEDVIITVIDPEGEILAKVEIPAEIPESPIQFVDVPEGHWAESAINQVAGLGLVHGVGDNRFDMDSNMKRGDLAVVLYNLSNGSEGYELTFEDVPADKYYAGSVAWAAAANVVTGISETEFAPENSITREELAVMLYRYAQLLRLDTTVDSTDGLDAFTDGSSISGWAEDSMAWCVENGIIKGQGNGILAPGSNATRAEVTVMLQRFVDLLGK